MTRLTPLDPTHLTAEQQVIYDQIAAGPRGKVTGSFLTLLHSPHLAGKVEELGVYVRFRSALPERLRELAILVVASHWRCAYEWNSHLAVARRLGIAADLLKRLSRGDEPVWDDGAPDEAVVHDYCTALLRSGHVAERLHAAATALLGERGVVDLTALVGYYTLLALTTNAHAVEPPGELEIPMRRG